jgi:hypothetical protein
MNEIQNEQFSEFVFRRLSEPVKLPWGGELSPFVWLWILGIILGFAVFYVIWMYRKDARGVGPYWASLLGFLRLCVYAVLALVFLLPAIQTGEKRVIVPKVLIGWDVSLSMLNTKDRLPDDQKGEKLKDVPVRQESVINLLSRDNFNFLNTLTKAGPVSAYRFGTRLDEAYFYFNGDRNFTRDELEAWRKNGSDKTQLPPETPLPMDLWKAWLRPVIEQEAGKEPKDPVGLNARELERWRKIRELNKQMQLGGDFSGTNIPTSLLTMIDREKNSLVQGIVIFTDGKNTVQNLETIETVVERAKAAKIPVFMVGVGADRPVVRIDIANVRLPRTVRPDDSFKGVVEVIGLGLPDKDVDVFFDVSHVRIIRKKLDGGAEEVKEEPLDLQLIERDEKVTDPNKLAKVNLTADKKVITLGPVKGKFDRSPIPKFDAEFPIDAKTLADAAGVKLDPNKKWELQTTETDPAGLRYSEIRFVARTPKNAGELIEATEHIAKPVGVAVVKKKLNVLVFSSSPSREYQFLRSMFQREVEKERVEFSIYLQNPPGKPDRREGVLQDIDQDRFLNFLPYRRNTEPNADELQYWLPAAEKRLERMKKKWRESAQAGEAEPTWPAPLELARTIAGFYDLGNYDAIIAVDPDWGRISDEPRAEDAIRTGGSGAGGKLNVPDLAARLKGIAEWVDNGGGLIVVGGAVNTIELARPRKAGLNENVFKPIQELYPVILQDIRVREIDNKADVPYPLNLDQASPEMDFLRLKDVGEGAGLFLADWTEFFGKSKENPSGVERGFYWYYPTERVRAGALVVARFNHPGAVMKDGTQQPFIVVSDPTSGRRVVWLASGEFWRLRTHHEAFHERFWTKLARYAAAGSQAKSSKRITLVMAPSFKANNYAEIEAKIDGLDGRPLKVDPKTEKADLPKVQVTIPQGLPAEAAIKTIDLQPKSGAEGWFSGKFLVRFPGPGYRLELRVPRTTDTDSRSFDVEESNPETDDTRPDFPLMYQMASEADDVLDRIKDEEMRNKVKRALSRPRPGKAAADDKQDGPTSEKLKLFFDMSNAHLIPSCMTMDPVNQRIRGPVRDQWDDGFTVYTPADKPNEPVKVSYILLLVVGLLSAEWLIRKLLRLA